MPLLSSSLTLSDSLWIAMSANSSVMMKMMMINDYNVYIENSIPANSSAIMMMMMVMMVIIIDVHIENSMSA